MVVDLSTGAPLPGAALSVFSAQDILLDELETNGEGIATLPLPSTVYTVHVRLEGFCDVEATVSADVSGDVAVVSMEPGTCARVTAQVANLRVGPGVAYPIVGKAQAGDVLKVVGLSEEEGSWLVVGWEQGTAWVSWDLVQVPGPMASLPTVTPPPLPTPFPTVVAEPTAMPSPQVVVVEGNMLSNPGFEMGSQGWVLRQATAWNADEALDIVTADGEPLSVLAGQAAGRLSQKKFMVYQEVRTAVPGVTYRLGARVRLWSSSGVDRKVSENPEPIAALVCLSTIGSHITDAPHAVCSAPTGVMDQWHSLTVEATAKSETLSAILWVLNYDSVNHRFMVGDASWDEVSLSAVGGSTP